MSDIIHLLPDAIANQIAAGEVVQRPASVVKELLENALDAKATSIQLIVKDAGKSLVQVIDNGKGMSETDARMSFERHATSKISKTEDLFNIRSFGFRGEALASIAAVAQVELKTKQEDDELGTLIVIDGSDIKKQEPTATATGTSLAIRNLFFNVPARRNFLKSNPVELKHIIDEFQRVAIANPEIAFSMYQGDMELFNLPVGKLSQRIVNVFGNQYREQLITCEEETPSLNIKGYIGKPEFAKKTRGEQFFFVNGRYIKSNYLNHAVIKAYEGLLADDTFPFYTLFIDIDPGRIDINVHPTKTEIKFDDERTTYGLVHAAIKKALATHNITPSIDFDKKVDLAALYPSSKEVNRQQEGNSFNVNPQRQRNTENWESLYKGMEKPLTNDAHNDTNVQREAMKFESAINKPSNEDSTPKEVPFDEGQVPYQFHNSYIISQVKSGMLLIDQQMAHERILYEKYMGMLDKRIGFSQQFLFPQNIELSPADFALVEEMEEEIKSLGFVFNYFSNNTIVVNGIPADVQSGDEKNLFEGLLEQFKHFQSELKVDRRETLARSLAKRSSIKRGRKLGVEEMKMLIDQLFACKTPNYGPNGDNTFIILDMDKIGKFFKN